MEQWQELLVSPMLPVSEAMTMLGNPAKQILLVVDTNQKLLGTVTDGDIRRGVLDLVAVDQPVSKVMNPSPVTTGPDDPMPETFNRLTGSRVQAIPIVDELGRIIGLKPAGPDQSSAENANSWVVLMAGGLGRRLQPLTNNAPKPMLIVGEKPLLETILETFIEHKFRRFFISINYRADVMKEFFEDGQKWGVEIEYLEESTKCGTAGALSLIKEELEEPLIVMNADLLTRVNFTQLLEYHRETGSDATMCVREYDFEVPYGVVEIENNKILDINEKPVQRFFVNAGIYALNPKLIQLIEPDTYLDMPVFFRSLTEKGYQASAFPITEYWMDIGRIDDYQRANKDYFNKF